MAGISEGVETFFKRCDNCDNFYRYQEYTEGIHNFNDLFLIGLVVCAYSRQSVNNHIAVDYFSKILAGVLNAPLHHQSIQNACVHFEAMSDRKYNFNCVMCGYYPTILIADDNRKVAFKS